MYIVPKKNYSRSSSNSESLASELLEKDWKNVYTLLVVLMEAIIHLAIFNSLTT